MYIAAEFCHNLKYFLKRMRDNREIKESYATKIIPIKLYTPLLSSVASFLVLWGGGGARPLNVPTGKKNHVHVTDMRERAPQKHIFFQVSKYICMHIQAMQFPLLIMAL